MLYSALIPGGGQLYNGAYLKAGAVVAIQSALLTNVIVEDANASKNKKRINEASPPWDDFYKEKYLHHKAKRNSGLWWMGLTGVLSMIDAYVDAHLVDFEERRDDLRLRFEGDMLKLEINF